LLAGALLAFALSFDEVIVTIFTAGGVKTLPIWIFQSFRLANQVPLVNVAGLVAILLSVIPVYLATRLSGGVVGARLNPASASGGRTRGLPLEARLDDHEPERQREESVGDDLAHGRPPPVAHPSGPMR
jgi:hypothetical protein